VQANEKAIRGYEAYIDSCDTSSRYFPDRSEETKAQIERCSLVLHSCTHPTELFYQNTVNEIAALEHLDVLRCEHVPALLDVLVNAVPRGIHEDAIEGGYLVCILMTKLPGKAISQCNFWDLSLQERDEIRSAFKEALL
jgi:hypothetical protein